MGRAAPTSLLAALLSSAALTAPAEEVRSAGTPEFAASTERVQADLVVRDKKGSILRDLTAADVEVYEDGVRQDVQSLAFVDRRPAGGVGSPGNPTPTVEPTFVAVVFDRLSPGARSFTQQAVLAYLDQVRPATSWMGIFSIDRGLTTIRAITDDREALRRSLGAGSSSFATTAFSGLAERDTIRNAYAGLSEGPGQAHVASAELSGVPECRGHEEDVIRRLELMDSRLLETFASLERDEQGFATTHALLSLIAGLQGLPGRKALVLFSEGLVIPAGVESTFRSVVSAANRARVSIYSAQAGGLAVVSAADETRRTIDSLQARLKLEGTGTVANRGPSNQDENISRLALLEQNEDALRFASESGLGRLADQTGGFLIRDTNDLSFGLAEMDDDLGAYYLLSYAPKAQAYDGRFRSITVRLKRPHGRLQARKGYLALKTTFPAPALDYEAPALARLEAGPRPTAVPLRLRGLQFPEQPLLPAVPIVVEVPARGLTFATDKKAGVFRQDFTIVALVRDGEKRVVAKMSQHYPLSGRLDGLEAARHQDVRFYRETHLPSGAYSVEAIVYDALSGAAGAAVSTVEVPATVSGHLRASSLMVVRSAEKLGAGEPGGPRPLRYHDVLLYPNLGQPLRREGGDALAFFVTAWPAPERPGVLARVEVVRDGRTVATTPATELRPDAEGRIQLASSLPLETFLPGVYELRVTLSDGQDRETRTAAVPIAP